MLGKVQILLEFVIIIQGGSKLSLLWKVAIVLFIVNVCESFSSVVN